MRQPTGPVSPLRARNDGSQQQGQAASVHGDRWRQPGRQPGDTSPGLDAWVECRPHQSDAGGDIHYFSMCGSGRVTRLAIADVMGHGEEASELAVWLRGLMRKHINLLDQRRFAHQINQELTSRETPAA